MDSTGSGVSMRLISSAGSEVKTLSDQALLNLIHDGIPQRGMPGFSDMGEEGSHAVVAYLRFFSKASPPGSLTRAIQSRGRDLFFGKAGLLRLSSDCEAADSSWPKTLQSLHETHPAGRDS